MPTSAATTRPAAADVQRVNQLTRQQLEAGASPRVDVLRSSIYLANALQALITAQGAERTGLLGDLRDEVLHDGGGGEHLTLDAWLALAESRRTSGDIVGARRAYRRAVELDPNDWRAWHELAGASKGEPRRLALAKGARLNPFGVTVP